MLLKSYICAMNRLTTLFLCTLALCISSRALSQGRLVAVTFEKVVPAAEQFQYVFRDYPNDIDPDAFSSAIKLIGKTSQDVRFVCLNYRTYDPNGNEVIASGLLALPEGRIKGVINVTPFCREKDWAGTVHKWTLECIPSMRGMAMLVPDTIGYGASADEVVALLMTYNAALVSVHFRQAVEEYLQTLEKPRKLPANTSFFGFSLGAAGALTTAKYYHAHPELNVKPKMLYIGDGAYDPVVSIESTIVAGECDYMLYPAIYQSLNQWKGLNLDKTKLFQGPILDNFDFVSGCDTDMTELAKVYGADLHGYLHPDWFKPGRNAEINRLMDFIKTMKVGVDRNSLPKNMKIYLRHSEEDRYVPIQCTDSLWEELRKAGYTNVKYIRKKTGSHYDMGGQSVIDVLLMKFF